MNPLSEARWTAPREECQHPELWTSTDVQSTEVEVTSLVAAFVRALQPEFVIETGTCIGQTAEAIGLALAANRHGRLVTLEPDNRLARIARARCGGLPVTVVERESLDYLRDISRLDERSVGFAWLDSLMDLRVPELESLRDYGWLAPGAVIGVHDTGSHKAALLGHQLLSIPWLQTLSLPTPRGVCFCQVRE
jgi:predicted O-methyltransferase YrrM